jgi:hypothetical protein
MKRERKGRRSAFLDGLARVFDLGGTLHRRRYVSTGFAKDVEAMRSDWVSIGNDMRSAIAKFECQEAHRIGKSRETGE